MRIGYGYDVHKLEKGRDLYLLGIKIPFELGLIAHSDGDVAIHALMDSLLGACGLCDIGTHFPDTDNQYKNIDSKELLKRVVELITSKGFRINNVDITIIAQKPKIAPYISQMREKMCEILQLDENKVNVKATTEEYLGFTGRLEGIKSVAVCTIYENGEI